MPVVSKPDPREQLIAMTRTEPFRVALIVLAGVVAVFWPLMRTFPDLWMSEDGYYSHGFLVPLISAYIVFRWWPRIRTTPVKPGYVALLFLLPLAWIGVAAVVADFRTFASVALLGTMLASVWFVAGFRWMLVLAGPILYLGFAFPMWSAIIDKYTLPLQLLSSEVAYQILNIFGFSPLRGTGPDATIVYLSNFTLDVGVPCSGLKLVLAVTAFSAFFIMIGGLQWWKNLIVLAIVLPLCLFINGLRIALIGIVGDRYGSDAGHAFHDYSGYITLLLCFFILFKLVRLLGWQD